MSKETSELCWTAYDSLKGCALPQVHCASVKKSSSSLMHIAGKTSVTLVTVLREMLNSPAPSIRNQNLVFRCGEAMRQVLRGLEKAIQIVGYGRSCGCSDSVAAVRGTGHLRNDRTPKACPFGAASELLVAVPNVR